MLKKREIINLIKNEIASPSFGVSEQYFPVLKFVYEKEELKIEYIDYESDGNVIVYLPIEDENFFYKFKFELVNGLYQISWIDVEEYNTIYLSVYSERKLNEYINLVSFEIEEPIDIGDKLLKGLSNYSGFSFQPIKHPEQFDIKLNKFLRELAIHKSEIEKLREYANLSIACVRDSYFSNGNTASFHLDIEAISILNELQLELGVDQYISGEDKSFE